MIKFICVVIIFSLVFGCDLKEDQHPKNKYQNIILKDSEIREIISEAVGDTFYIYVRLPKNYNKINKTYPVLYLLDGDISFNMATSIVRYLQYGNDIPDIIIIGVGYGSMLNDGEQNFRERDYTISKVERFYGSGGGNNFLKFIKNELIPFVDKNYKTNKLRVLNGFSLGGLMTINILLNQPSLFNYYIAGSPYLINDIDSLIKQNWLINNLKNKKVFISIGETEDKKDYHEPINKIVEKLNSIKNLETRFIEFKDGTHFTSPAEALTYGLKFVFKENKF
jgi:hypothetical protein